MKGSVKQKLMGMEDKYSRVESTELDIKKLMAVMFTWKTVETPQWLPGENKEEIWR